ncbi:MazG-like family protein [Shimia sp.]|uniref:MazG-like family protein n=1 Tax=Shimia sp. TaxID=1954381 RepID=UPI003B8D753C
MTIFQDLREANVSRQAEWTGNDQADAAFRALELADEVGEVLASIKKWLRAQRDICGTTMTLQDVADEIGDAIISLDLLLCEVGVAHLPRNPFAEMRVTSSARIGLLIDGKAGQISLLMFEGTSSSVTPRRANKLRNELAHLTADLVALFIHLATVLGLNFEQLIAVKFNKTSEKYGLTTRMEVSSCN